MSESINWTYEIVSLVGTFAAAGVGAWLSVRYLPLKAKHDEWRWNKKIQAQEFIFDALSEMAFVSQNHLNSEFHDSFSMAGLKVTETETIIFDRIRSLHKREAGLSLSLTDEQSFALKQFLELTQKALDAAKESWDDVDPNDPREIEAHTNQTIEELGTIAVESLKQLRPLIKREYR